MRTVLPPSINRDSIVAWSLTESDLKRYPHFDKHLPVAEIEKIIKDPSLVAQNAFYPFLCYQQTWQPFRKLEARPDKKTRLIRYASRRDAQIFAYYRHLLSAPYESALDELGLSECPIAYRNIPLDDSGRGKCNIDFAKDAFQAIENYGACSAVTLDISSYFECIDHDRLKCLWCRMLGVDKLPPDHYAVFKAITRYAMVDRNRAYERLGFFGPKLRRSGVISDGFVIPHRKIPWQLCSPEEFRQKIRGDSEEFESLISVNQDDFGIPQGAPISDLLANLYLIDFDRAVHEYVSNRGGYYTRYSDDILLILPGDKQRGRSAKKFVMDLIGKFGDELRIKESKTGIVDFQLDSAGAQEAIWIEGKQGKNGLEYLGFRFDGKRVFLRDSTLSRFHRKIVFAARAETNRFVRANRGLDFDELIDKFDAKRFESKFGRVEEFEHSSEYSTWTFWTYAKRSAETFGVNGRRIYHQLRNHRDFIRRTLNKEMASAMQRAERYDTLEV